MSDRLKLSAQGSAQRDAIRQTILDRAPAIARRRKRNRQSFQALVVAAVITIAAIPFVLRTTPAQPGNIATTADPVLPSTSVSIVQITNISTDLSILERLGLETLSNPHVQTITDEELLSTLESLGIQTGMIKTDTQTILTRDVVAALSPPPHTTDS